MHLKSARRLTPHLDSALSDMNSYKDHPIEHNFAFTVYNVSTLLWLKGLKYAKDRRSSKTAVN